MNKKTEEKKNADGTKRIVQTIETTPEDGFVHLADINKTDVDNYRKYHKGYSKNISISTNDPRIIRPFVYGMCGIFFGIGLFIIFLQVWFFGIIFVVPAVFAFFKVKHDIDNIEKAFFKNPNYNPDDKEVIKEFNKGVETAFVDVTKSTFTKKKFKSFVKESLPIYCIISIVIFILLSIFINLFLGLFILVLLIFCGIIYYWIVSRICKW